MSKNHWRQNLVTGVHNQLSKKRNPRGRHNLHARRASRVVGEKEAPSFMLEAAGGVEG